MTMIDAALAGLSVQGGEIKPLKPYFCPLYKEYYLLIEHGRQLCEIRPNKHRSWNTNNLFPGRWITFSNGYGKHNRCTKLVTAADVVSDLFEADIPGWHIEAVNKIYGEQELWLVVYF